MEHRQIRHQPNTQERSHQPGTGRDENEIRRQGQGEPRPHRRAVHCGDDRLFQLGQCAEPALVAQHHVTPGESRIIAERIARQIRTGAKSTAGASEHHGAHRLIVPRGFDGALHGLGHGRIQGVTLARPVEGD
ncbi:hypothetical protein D3C79_813920 [compost metagenome]